MIQFFLIQRAKQYFLLFATLFVAVGCGPAKTELQPRPGSIQISKNVILAGLIDGYLDAELLESDTLVVDLRMAEEEGASEQATRLGKVGIRLLQFPMGRNVPTLEQVKSFEGVLRKNGDRPILVHCSSGNRAGLLWGVHLIEQGVEVEEAVTKVRAIANRESTQNAMRSYVKGGSQ